MVENLVPYKLSEWNIQDVVSNCLGFQTASSMIFSILKYWKLSLYINQLKDYNVIELGPGSYPIVKYCECKSYEWVDISSTKTPYNIKNIDALTYLRNCEDKSAVIVSMSMFSEDVIIYSTFSDHYMKELAYHIKRVSYPFAIVVWFVGTDKYLWEPTIPYRDSIVKWWVYLFDKQF